jgi:c-di-GMP-binding flagellar brake protein YcgR
MIPSDRSILQDAIVRNTGVVLSLPSAGMLRHHKSRFLGEVESTILLESPPSEKLLIDALIATRQSCGIAFKKDHNKVIFAAPIRSRQTEFRINSDTLVEALLLEFPAEIKSFQRRTNYRVRVMADGDISVRIWRVGPRAAVRDIPMASQEIKAELRDISVGGIGVLLHGKDGAEPLVSPADRLRVQLVFGPHTLLMEGRMRAPSGQQTPGRILTGVQFQNLEDDIKGRQNLALLTRMVGEMQRDEVRRFRLGMLETA